MGLLGLIGSALSQVWAEDADLAELFSSAGVAGTIVISPVDKGEMFVHDNVRAEQRFPAASTFKILNTLISLEENAISMHDTIKWDGTSRAVPDWNRDQTLESAFRTSCVWCYQQFAQKVGAEKYRHYLTIAGYGRLHEPFNETTFWLDGSLQVSAIEQVEFLKSVYRRSMPFKDSSYESLRRIMLVEPAVAYALRAKTGWSTQAVPHIGWYVGYVETPGGTWFFAMNMDTPDREALPLREKLALAALRAKGIIE